MMATTFILYYSKKKSSRNWLKFAIVLLEKKYKIRFRVTFCAAEFFILRCVTAKS